VKFRLCLLFCNYFLVLVLRVLYVFSYKKKQSKVEYFYSLITVIEGVVVSSLELEVHDMDSLQTQTVLT
jgi:hypothetical protein